MLKSLILNGTPWPTEHAQVAVPWWSFTKTVLSAAALCLVRDGVVRLDEPVAEGPFTLRQLLKHQAGLADYSELKAYHSAVAENQAPWPAHEMLQRLDANRLRYKPGTAWRYSNVGYMWVARLIERLSGQPLEEALIQQVFSPLGLTRVRLVRTQEDLSDVHPPTMAAYHPRWVYHGLLVGPLDEAAQLLDGLLAGRLLPPSLLEAMQDAIVLGGPIPGRPWATPGYGLGLMIGETNSGHRLVGHTGGGPGSVIAVYQCDHGDQVATCAVFSEGHDEGAVESAALMQLTSHS
ncbi:serine hydrolase domain-containing protein [Pseudomonas sp. S2_C03]